MRFSIVIPVYNVSDYIDKCLASVLANDCSDCEIILVDDGSTDGVSPAICDKYSLQYPDLIRTIHQENKGLGGARNTGLEAANGEYMFFVDSDDTITADAMTILRKAVEKSQADIIAFNIYSDDGEGHLTPMKANAFETEAPFSLSDKPNFLLSMPSAVCRVWKRSLFMDSGVRYPSRVWYEDIRTSTKLFALAKSIYTIEDMLYMYLQRPGSIMNSGNLSRNQEIIWAFDDFVTWYRENGLFEKYHDELCQLAVNHVLLVASCRVARIDPKADLLKSFDEYMKTNFPDYAQNKYYGSLSSSHKLLLWLLNHKMFGAVKLLFTIKNI